VRQIRGDSVDKVKRAWYGSITLEGHVPDKGAPAKFGEVDWSDKRPDVQYVDMIMDYAETHFFPIPPEIKDIIRRAAKYIAGIGDVRISERQYAESIYSKMSTRRLVVKSTR
jgi:hypothetical protein